MAQMMAKAAADGFGAAETYSGMHLCARLNMAQKLSERKLGAVFFVISDQLSVISYQREVAETE